MNLDLLFSFQNLGKLFFRNRWLTKMIVLSTIPFHLLLAQSNENQSNLRESGNIIYSKDSVYPSLFEGRTDEENLIESMSYLKGEGLLSTPSDFISNSFIGRLGGIYGTQISGMPGSDGVNLSLRGRTPVVLVDGIPREFFSVNPEQIESVSILKDALSTALFGMRSMNGIISIKTRNGKNRPLGNSFEVKVQRGVSMPISMPKPLNAYNYANLYNEALTNDGFDPIYSNNDLESYKSGSDPLSHPDINWYDEILKRQSSFTRFTIDADGNNEKMSYFVNFDYSNQNGLLKESDENTYKTNVINNRFIFRSNLDVVLNPRFSTSLNVFGQIIDLNEPGKGAEGIFTALRNTPANAYPIMNIDSSLGGNFNFNDNIYGLAYQSGARKTISSNGAADLKLRIDMDDIWKGWWIQGKASYNLSLIQRIDRSKDFETYEMIVRSTDTIYQRYGNKTDQLNNSSIQGREEFFFFEGLTGINRALGKNNLDVLLLYQYDNLSADSDLPNIFQNYATKVKFNVNSKYVVEGVASYSGNNRYKPGNRFGFFPAIGAAWNINREGFYNQDGFVNGLKLRASYGLTGNSVAGYFDYVDHYGGATGYSFGASVASASGRGYKQPRNVKTWEKARKFNGGVDLEFAKNQGFLSFDYYRNNFNDLVITRRDVSGVGGWSNNIVTNLGRNLYSGIEAVAGWSKTIGEFRYSISGNLSVNQSKVLYNDEPNYPYDWMKEEGAKVGAMFGYVAEGLIDKDGVGNVVQGYEGKPGDIKYKDLNNDGIINEFDQQEVGRKGPLVFYGAEFAIAWKKFGLSFLLQGVSNRDLALTGANQWEFQSDGLGPAWEHNLSRWTTSHSEIAEFPRATIGQNFNNNVFSSFWVESGDYLRLKNVELSWTSADIDFWKIKLKYLKFFMNGFNLLTLSKVKDIRDPEIPINIYPNQMLLNGGISIKF